MEKIEWSDDLALGIAVIDEQHHHFVDLINEFYDALAAQKEHAVLGYYLATLSQYAEEHFATEEKYFQEFQYPQAAEHIEAHRDLSNRLNKLIADFDKGGQKVAAALLDFLTDWLENHLAKEDKKYVQCFHQHGLK